MRALVCCMRRGAALLECLRNKPSAIIATRNSSDGSRSPMMTMTMKRYLLSKNVDQIALLQCLEKLHSEGMLQVKRRPLPS